MSSRHSLWLVMVLTILTLLPGHAAESLLPVTAGDPTVSTKELALRLDPLTSDELAVEAAAWQDLLKAKVTAISETAIAARAPDAAVSLNDSLTQLRDEKSALAERLDEVLDAWEIKGGDAEKARKYASAVTGIRAQATDIGSSWHLFSGWLSSKEGGIKWGIHLIQFTLVMLVFWILASVVAKVVSKGLERQPTISGLLRNFINTMSRRVVLAVGLLVALGTIGVNVGAALALIGGGAFVLAFALQDTLGNFANGLMLLIYRPFDVGDAVEIGGVTGKVFSVSLVNTTLHTFDNQKVIVPNKNVWGQVITNITGMPTRRVDMKFGIGYDDDAGVARDILERVLREHDMVLEEPEPAVQLHELADSSVNFICRPWAVTENYWTVFWDVTQQVKQEFHAAGISIPYPQRNLHVHSVAPPPAP